MKKKKIFLWMLIAIGLSTGLHAQTGELDPAIVNTFPAHIVYRVYDVASRTELTLHQQWQLADYFRNQDSLATLALKTGTPPSKLKDFYSRQTEQYTAILTPVGLNDYQTTNNVFRSQSSAVLRYRKQLRLTDQQIARVAQLCQSWGDQNLYDNTQLKKQDALELRKILTPQQFDQSLPIFYQRKANGNILADYEHAKEYGLLTGSDSSSLKNAIQNFRLNNAIANDMAAFTDHPEAAADSLKKKNDAFEPAIIFRLQALRGGAPTSELATILKDGKQIHLRPAQIDSLIGRMQTLEQLRYTAYLKGEKYISKAYEKESMAKLLDSTQIEIYFVERNRDKAALAAAQDLSDLQDANLLADADIDKLKEEVTQYELTNLASRDRLFYDKSTRNELLRKAAFYNKPDALKKLDQQKKIADAKDAAKKNFAW